MNPRPGPSLHEPLHSRGSVVPPHSQARRQPSRPLIQPDCIDPTLEDERPAVHNAAPDTSRPPPKGRPHLFYNTNTSSGLALPIHPFPLQPTANLPAPPRPGSVHLRDASQQQRIQPGGTGVKDYPKYNVHEVVPSPVHVGPGKAADVFPWTGNNPEDTLSEALVKAGISNKPQIMNETNTARPSLWSNLKNKSGLTTLSTLFVAVLEKRQQSGRLQVPNTFKPPPRLTLRDSTREQWLHDLSNPGTSLRRLSRTIPHGLTGKVLLEQCLNKNIPLPRALWLAKCVGINELRAHKRKGQAGTITWGRGWTSSVEQFMDGVIGAIGQGEWKPRVTYALQLATQLYKEHLLDDDHFLDWIIHGLDSCPSERLFIWLFMVQISHYWTDITCCRYRGRRLAESLLNHLGKIYRLDDTGPHSVVLLYLENTLTKLLATRPACLLLPTTWAKHSAQIKRLTERRTHPQMKQAIKKLEQRNIRLLQSAKMRSSTSRSPAGRIYRLLDTASDTHPYRIEDLSYECMEIISDATLLIAVVLQWACSYYREGVHRTYLTTRLLRRWSHQGADVYDAVISYLRDMSWVGTGDLSIIFRIVAELVRSKTFAAGRYLQWLIATGSLGHDSDLSSPDSWPVRLITEIPLTGLPDQIRTLRSTLLRGTAHAAEVEQQMLFRAEQQISLTLPALFGLYDTSVNLTDLKLDTLSPTVKLELGIWLRGNVASYAEVNERVPTKDPSIEETAAVSLISPLEFHIVRSYLERFEDLAILADVIGIAASSLDPAVLAAAADTINYHVKAFRAMGACDPLFGRIAARYAALRTMRFPERELLLSLSNLARVVHADGQLSQLLSYDLSRLDQKNSLAACSPASDNMGEVMQTGSYSDDEIERVLSSGTSMDQQMMARVLRKIINNHQEQVHKGQVHFDSYPAWFHRLRSFDEPTFDMVTSEWLSSTLTSHQIDILRVALPTLVGSGCVALQTFLDTLQASVAKLKTSPTESGVQIAVEGLRILLPCETLAPSCPPQDAYRYRLEQRKLGGLTQRCVGDIVGLLSTTSPPSVQGQVSVLLLSEPMIALMKQSVVTDPGSLSKLGREMKGPYVTALFNVLLDPSGGFQVANVTPSEKVPIVFEVASDLSLPICQAVIEHIFSSEAALSGETSDALPAALLSAIKTAVEEDRSAGLELLASLDVSLTDQIRQHAEREILQATTFLAQGSSVKPEEIYQHSPAVVQKYLTVIDLTSSKRVEITDQSVMAIALAERLKGVAQAFAHCEAMVEQTGQKNDAVVLSLYAWLNALLRLAIAHCPAMLRNATQQHQSTLMYAMKSLITHPFLALYPSVTEHIFDVAVFLSDYISDDVRSQVARLDNVRPTDDARCLFMLGATAPVDGWLVLTKPLNPLAQPSLQPPTPNPLQSQPQNYQTSQPSGTGPATPQQRYFNQQRQQQQQQQQQQQLQTQQAQQQAQQQQRQYQQYSQHPNKMLPAQLQRNPSFQNSQSQLQQMQHMQQMQGLAQQRATQPSPVSAQRPTPTSQNSYSGAAPGKLQIRHEKEMRQYPFVQPRWEILADSSGNPNANDTAISLSLFGARKV
ncbi:hypothetical protein T440DRAFT_437396 [Plenodomus tracheiphilus IPT5]|uniref:Mediator of RNA polymerase II transcription subunit 12 n=1 Tax=Plenodomus tracheiphilus IPT5 TaxID=1408161 RepID=A0A6A7BPW4_9PLEO|nr:hypothetical protein T440DRAFT_437396 [Plenodomus tracheiphilus IPT5]